MVILSIKKSFGLLPCKIDKARGRWNLHQMIVFIEAHVISSGLSIFRKAYRKCLLRFILIRCLQSQLEASAY